MTDLLVAFAGNVKARRRELGLTQEAVGWEAGMDQSQYSRIERGEVDPSIRTMTRIARALQTTPNALLAGIE